LCTKTVVEFVQSDEHEPRFLNIKGADLVLKTVEHGLEQAKSNGRTPSQFFLNQYDRMIHAINDAKF